MKVYEILETLQGEIENASNVPLTNKVMLDKDEILDLIDELREAIPADISQAQKIKESENRIKLKAAEEAKNILDQANEHKAKLIDSSAITKNAYDEAEAILKDANAEAARMRVKSLDYVASVLTKTQGELKELIALLDTNKEELKEKKKMLSGTKQNAEAAQAPAQAQQPRKPQQ